MKITTIGKLRIYMTTDETEASGIINAHVFSYPCRSAKGGKLTYHTIEEDTSGLIVCIEFVDEKVKLKQFFKTHKDLLKENTVFYKDVESWAYNYY